MGLVLVGAAFSVAPVRPMSFIDPGALVVLGSDLQRARIVSLTVWSPKNGVYRLICSGHAVLLQGGEAPFVWCLDPLLRIM